MPKVLNIGSINLDNVYTVDHFVQPGETLASSALAIFAGGKGLNQSIALAKAGAEVYHVGCIGQDGAFAAEALAAAGVNTQLMQTSTTTTGHAMIQVNAKGQNCILLFPGANHTLTESYIDSVLCHFSAGDLLVLQNEVNLVPYAMQQAHKKGMKIALNPSPINDALLQYPIELVSWLILNEVEAQALSGKTKPADMLAQLQQRYPSTAIVLTVGKDGVLYSDGQQALHHGIYDVPVVDTTAAGDTFTGYFLARLCAGDAPQEALRLASLASSLAVSRTGASPSIPALAEVLSAPLSLMVAPAP